LIAPQRTAARPSVPCRKRKPRCGSLPRRGQQEENTLHPRHTPRRASRQAPTACAVYDGRACSTTRNRGGDNGTTASSRRHRAA
jgi:hypothetical protein